MPLVSEGGACLPVARCGPRRRPRSRKYRRPPPPPPNCSKSPLPSSYLSNEALPKQVRAGRRSLPIRSFSAVQ